MRPLGWSLVLLSIFAGSLGLRAEARPARRVISRSIPGLTSDGRPNIQAQAAVIVDLKSGGEYYAKNADAIRPIASISKLMAVLVVLEKGLKLDAVIESTQAVAINVKDTTTSVSTTTSYMAERVVSPVIRVSGLLVGVRAAASFLARRGQK